MVIFDEEDMKWAMEVFNVGKVVYPNQETLDVMEEAEAIASGKIETRSYKTFNDMWSDICETKDS